MKILIVEDEPFVADDLKDKLDKLQYPVIGVAESYDETIALIEKEKPDLVLLDIELKGELTGIDLSEQLRKYNIPFVYLSSVQDLSTYYKAKDTGPLRNLAKPIDLLSLRNALLEIQQLPETVSKQEELLLFYTNKDGIRQRFFLEDVIYFEAARSYCDVYFKDEKKVTLSTAMGNVVKKLDHPDFIRISSSFCINKNHVQSIRGNEVQLSVGPFLRISDSYKEAFNRNIKLI